MKKDSIFTVAAGENAGLPDPLLETPDREAPHFSASINVQEKNHG